MRKRQVIATAILTIAMIVIWNGYLFLDWQKTPGPSSSVWQPDANSVAVSIDPKEPKLWQDIKKTVVGESSDGGFDPQFDDSVIAVDCQEVELPGVGFLLSSGLHEDANGEEKVTEFLLLPSHGGVAWCCGLSPISHHEFSVLVDCHDTPFSASGIDRRSPAFFVNVRGVLRLERENTLNALYTLEDVNLEFLGIEDVLPADVMNLCLNRRMTPQDLIRGPNSQSTQPSIEPPAQGSP